MEINDGRYFEQIVQIIEKSIDPNASIEHDVMMPVLNSPSGRKRQCDIVITTGKKPRETVSIVEVQDRKTKVEINEFNGWLSKLNEIGAQHLICVSKQEFPESIQEVAAQNGNRVRLIQLTNFPSSKIPLDIFFNDFNISLFEIVAIGNLKINIDESKNNEEQLLSILVSNGKVDVNHKFIFHEDFGLISLYQYCQNHQIVKNNESGQSLMTISTNLDPKTKFQINGQIKPGEMTFEMKWESEVIKVPINLLTYNQDGDTLAWLAEASYEVPQGPIEFKFGITPNEDGYNITILNSSIIMPEDSTLIIRTN
jgi:hypothetical protein